MHFSEQEWLLFYLKQLDSAHLELMEEHLGICDECTEHFLKCISQTEVEQAAGIINADFTLRTMDYINSARRITVKPGSSRHKRRRMLLNYVAAAAVTMILMGGGVFQSVVDQASSLPQSKDNGIFRNYQPSLLFTWPNRLEASTSEWVNRISFSKLKEVKW